MLDFNMTYYNAMEACAFHMINSYLGGDSMFSCQISDYYWDIEEIEFYDGTIENLKRVIMMQLVNISHHKERALYPITGINLTNAELNTALRDPFCADNGFERKWNDWLQSTTRLYTLMIISKNL
jgi:hypothetical protein